MELTQESHQLAKKFKDLNCFVTMNEDFSNKKAGAIDLEKEKQFVLLGIPLAQKDLLCTEGTKNNSSSKILSNFFPPYTATAVKKFMMLDQ